MAAVQSACQMATGWTATVGSKGLLGRAISPPRGHLAVLNTFTRRQRFPADHRNKMGKNKNAGGGKGDKGAAKGGDEKDAGSGKQKLGMEIKVRHILW